MRILRRYILGEVTSHALIGTGIFTFVIFTKELGQILELVVRNSAPLPSAIQLYLLIIPGALTITLPAGVLIGVLLGLYVCSYPAANAIDVLFYSRGGLGRISWSGVVWLGLNLLVLLAGWLAIFAGAMRLVH